MDTFLLLLTIPVILFSRFIFIILRRPIILILDESKKSNIITVSVSILISLWFFVFLVIRDPTSKNDAIINAQKDTYIVSITWEQLSMVHDPIFALLKPTSPGNFEIILPRNYWVINGKEIPISNWYYGYLWNVTFDDDTIIIDLYYDNYDDNIKDPVWWNWIYKLKLKE